MLQTIQRLPAATPNKLFARPADVLCVRVGQVRREARHHTNIHTAGARKDLQTMADAGQEERQTAGHEARLRLRVGPILEE